MVVVPGQLWRPLRAHPGQVILNFDIGGGTTNLALGRAGEVLRTGCFFVGARHIQVVPGSYRILKVSRYARALLDHLGLSVKGPGECLTATEVQRILDFYVTLLETAVTGQPAPVDEPVARLHEQVRFHRPMELKDVAVTLSGGVGELIYAHMQDNPWPATTCFGDLGIDLAQRISASAILGKDLKRFRPAAGGRATVYGLLRHSTEVSGTTLFLPHPEVLPLADVPILGSVTGLSTVDHVRNLVEMARRSPRGGCLQVSAGGQDAVSVRELGAKFAGALREVALPSRQPLVLLVRENIGKVLGQYVTAWGALDLNLVVIDELAPRDAQYVRIGSVRGQVVPVSFYGLN